MISKRIEIFNRIQNLRYTLKKEEGICNCQTKCDILKNEFKNIGLSSKPVLCSYSWEDMGLPQNLLDIPRGQELPLHVYLSVFIPETGQWVAVDPTWDAALKHPIICPTLWDGINATKIAVKPIKTFTDKQTDAFYSSITPEMEKTYMKENKKFLYAFSDYLEKLRK